MALGNPEPIELQHLYRAMDVLLEYREMIHKEVFWAVADLLNLEVDLIFFDTTSTYLRGTRKTKRVSAVMATRRITGRTFRRL